MTIDWASSDEDEFPDLDVVLARAKASQPSNTEPVSTRRPPRSRTIAPRRLTSPELSSEEDERKEKADTAPAKASTVRRRRLAPRSGNSSLRVSENDEFDKPLVRGLDVDKGRREKQPVVKVQRVRSSSKTPDVSSDDKEVSGQTDESTEEDGLSDFIVHTDDDSDFAAETTSRPRAARPKRETRHQRPPVDQDAAPEVASPEIAAPKVPVRKAKRILLGRSVSRELSAPIDDAVTDSLARLDMTASGTERQRTPPLTPPKPTSRARTLISPQKLPGIPKTPHRPSMDIFWDQEFFSEWNEEHSPRKLFLPKVDRSPTKSPAKDDKAKEDKAKVMSDKAARKLFDARKHKLAESFLRELDATITDGKIHDLAASTGGVKINWSKTLNTTAGRANWKRETIRAAPGPGAAPDARRHHHHASIELAEKVISDEHRLLNVLAHEFCHLANFMVTGITTNPHGKEFKAWASRVSRAFADRDIEVTTKHSYEIDFKYVWTCGACGLEYKRHSRSINPERHRCGGCKGTLDQTRPAPRGVKAAGVMSRAAALGAEAKRKKEPTEYQRFVKEQMSVVREENPGSPQKDMMRLVAEKWTRTRGVKKGDRSREASVEGVADQLVHLAL